MESPYLNSVRIDRERCTGCLLCVKNCLVQAIRVRNGKAVINSNRCIDCGECVRHCPTRAVTTWAEPLTELKKYKVNIALVTPSFYAQFDTSVPSAVLWAGLREIGFDSAFDVPLAGDYIAEEIEAYLAACQGPFPVISSACPAVLRLLQTKYPELLSHVVPALAPAEAAATFAAVVYILFSARAAMSLFASSKRSAVKPARYRMSKGFASFMSKGSRESISSSLIFPLASTGTFLNSMDTSRSREYLLVVVSS